MGNKIILPYGIETGQISDGFHTFDELYEHRQMLFSKLVSAFPEISWKSKKHDDGSMFEGPENWFIAGIELPTGMVTYHMEDKFWEHAECPELEFAPPWDGHTASDVLARFGEWRPKMK
jgi:hypothetical protein